MFISVVRAEEVELKWEFVCVSRNSHQVGVLGVDDSSFPDMVPKMLTCVHVLVKFSSKLKTLHCGILIG